MFNERYSSGDWGRDRSRRGHGGGHGNHGGHTNNGGYRSLVQEPGTHLLFIGSYSCVRHKGTERLQLQKEGKLSFLCLQEIDWITGDYLSQIEEASQEILQLYPVKKLILFGGCQLELLNVDFNLITKDLTQQLGIPVVFHKGCHLVGYGTEEEEN